MSQIPWWGLPLVAAVFALAGAAAAQFAAARSRDLLSRRRRTRRWYEERRGAYVQLLSAFERAIVRLRATFESGEKPPSVLAYIDEVGPALMPVRLLASGPVRSAALAVHLQLERLHGPMNPAGVAGVRPETHFRELLAQVPLVMQQFEAAIREELGIEDTPPPVSHNANGRARRLPRWAVRATENGTALTGPDRERQ
ncbi:hypothetical protein [Actinoplanes teichomyceticus]|uniref:Uncharacterized protein n=1 Tax=Actinoplanes teichomyceticus TaxID=1867 RepID=A0A561VSH8_ACTTI|nr:hypothetical protein [Actinoplanes teichomyceticus]TWG14579.1 hypothetical protein FHX34_104884 [Actinoplanes teichomyceticus]GIF09983.1 hypothetical protein Ate01nite_00150 [Actinoplanes teichomyceticus]